MPEGMKTPRDSTNHIESQYVPEVARLEIPLRSVVNLRRVAEELRGLAAHLERISRDTNPTAGSLLFEAAGCVLHTRRRLLAIRRPGRPTKSR
jgi:hypothetical protein